MRKVTILNSTIPDDDPRFSMLLTAGEGYYRCRCIEALLSGEYNLAYTLSVVAEAKTKAEIHKVNTAVSKIVLSFVSTTEYKATRCIEMLEAKMQLCDVRALLAGILYEEAYDAD